MKKITLALGLGAVMAVGFSSCDTYDIYPEQYGKVISIKNAGDRDITVWTTDPTASDTIIVMKGGHNPEGSSVVSLRGMTDADWAAYMDETRNEGLLRITPECYTFYNEDGTENNEVVINFNGDKDRYSVKRFYVKSAPLMQWYVDNQAEIDKGRIPVIPVMIASTNPGDSINADNKYVMYHPVLTTPQVGLSETGAIIRKLLPTDVGQEGQTINFNEVTVNLPSQLLWDFNVYMAFNPNFLTKYQEGHEDAADWQVMDKSWFSFDTDAYPHITDMQGTKTLMKYSFTKGGSNKLSMGITVDLSKVDPEADINTTFVIPMAFVRTPDSEDPAFAATGLSCKKDTILLGFEVEKIYNLHELTIDETMVRSNVTEPSEGAIAYMFDDDTSTFWHSTWSKKVALSAPFYAYIEIDVPEEGLNSCGFVWTNRGSGNTGVPSTVDVWGTDVENPTDADWWQVGKTMTNCDAAIGTAGGATGNIGDDRHPFISEKPFSKVRFCVSKSTRGALTAEAGSAYFNCSEFRMLGGKN